MYNIKTFGDLNKEKTTNRFPQLFVGMFQIFNTYPLEWRNLITKTNRNHVNILNDIPVELNKWQEIENVNIKQISRYLFTKASTENITDYVIKRHKVPLVDQHSYLNRKNQFVEVNRKDMKLRNIQYKILHNIYPTMKHLHTWKIKDTPKCCLCGVEETLKHAIFDCQIATNCWNKLKLMLRHNLDE